MKCHLRFMKYGFRYTKQAKGFNCVLIVLFGFSLGLLTSDYAAEPTEYQLAKTNFNLHFDLMRLAI